MKSLTLLMIVVALAALVIAFVPGLAKSLAEKAHNTTFGYMANHGLVLGMAEISSREKTLIAAGDKVQTVQGAKKVCVFHSPATAAWAQNDTFASGMRIPAGSRILCGSFVSHGAMAASVTIDVGLRKSSDGTVIDADGIAVDVSVASAGRTAINNGALVAAGVDSVLEFDAEPYVTIEGANPTDDIQMRFEIEYLPPG